MTDLLRSYDVEVVALSTDSPEQAAVHRTRDGLSCTLLSDTSHAVIGTYGLDIRHMRYVTWFHHLIPLGIPTRFSTIAIPTTILVDEDGIIQWIDTATDYRIRSESGRIARELALAFGQPEPGNT